MATRSPSLTIDSRPGTPGRRVLAALALVALLAGLPLAAVAGAVATAAPAAAAGSTLVGYHATYGAYQVQTLGIQATGPSPTGDGTYTLALNGVPTTPIRYDASLADFVAAVETTGYDVVDATGGPDGLSPYIGYARFTLTFATDPGSPLTVVDNQTWLPVWGGLPGSINADCIYCMDITPPTGTPNGGAMIFLHGGGLVSGNRDLGVVDEYAAQARAAGWVTASANYRISQYARGFTTCDLDQATLGTDPCTKYIQAADDGAADAQVAVQWFADHAAEYGIDPNKVVLTGGSAGGIVALTANYRAPGPGGRRPAAAASIAGAVRDQLVTAGAPPVFYGAFTHDPGYQGLGMDVFEEGRELLSKARVTGNYVDLHGYAGYGHVPEPTLGNYPGARDTTAEAADLSSSILAFFDSRVLRPTTAGGVQWFGQPAPTLVSRPLGGQTLFTRSTESRRPITGDFNGDGRSDLLWYGVGSAADTLWLAKTDGTFGDPVEQNANTALGYVPFLDQPGSFTNVVVGDVDGNGRDDVLWWNLGTIQLWRFGLRADGKPTVTTPAGVLPQLVLPQIGDFDGDKRADVYWWGPGPTPDYVWYGNADGTFTNPGTAPDPGLSLLQPAVGDLDGDGRSDIFWRNAFGANRLWFGADRASRFTTAATALVPDTTGTGDRVVVGDYDGDKRADLFVYGIGSRPDALWRFVTDPGTGALTATRTTFTLGGSADLRAADLDGDGRSDLLAYTAGAAQLPVWRGGVGGTFTVTNVALGRSGTPVIGRFDGVVGGASHLRADLYWR